jgi:hypothetical protein
MHVVYCILRLWLVHGQGSGWPTGARDLQVRNVRYDIRWLGTMTSIETSVGLMTWESNDRWNTCCTPSTMSKQPIHLADSVSGLDTGLSCPVINSKTTSQGVAFFMPLVSECTV